MVELKNYPGYKVSSDGKVYGKSGLPLKGFMSRGGYLRMKLFVDGRYVHRGVHQLVAEQFVPGSGEVVRHLDGDPLNNGVNNLAWGSFQDNSRDMVRHGRSLQGKKHHKAKITEDVALTIRGLGAAGFSHRELGDMFGLNHTTAGDIVRGERWAHL